jgi:hypothetical protein
MREFREGERGMPPEMRFGFFFLEKNDKSRSFIIFRFLKNKVIMAHL